jgi:hypothetical protein
LITDPTAALLDLQLFVEEILKPQLDAGSASRSQAAG